VNLRTKTSSFNGLGTYFSLENKLKKVEEALQESQQRFSQVVENLYQGIFIIDKNATITYSNSFFTKMLGVTSEDIIGKNIADFIDTTSKAIVTRVLSAKKKQVQHDYELGFVKQDKKIIITMTYFTPLFNKKINEMEMFAAVQDISNRKYMEYELQEKLDKLQKSELATLNIMEDLQNTISALTLAETQVRDKNRELQKINVELSSAREELTLLNKDLEKKVKERTADVEKLLKQKDEFVNQLGHDLKTPLTPLNILIPLIQQQEQNPKLKELLDIVSNNMQYMKNLVVKTLALAELNSPNYTFNFKEINLSQQVCNMLGIESTLFEENNVSIQNNIPQDVIVSADFLQIKELFDNLISNAIKYSQEGGVTITLDAQKKDDIIIVSVKDNGIGLEPNQIQHVFDEFYKVDYSRHDLQSTGLGLSICKRIVEKHGGRIWVESPGKGKGSTFFFTLKQLKN
jgi:PAS domain S-box-containing protein